MRQPIQFYILDYLSRRLYALRNSLEDLQARIDQAAGRFYSET